MNIDTINEQFVTINILSIDVSDHKISESDAFKNIYDHTYKMAESEKYNPDREPIFVFMVEVTGHSIKAKKRMKAEFDWIDKIALRKPTKIFFLMCYSLIAVIEDQTNALLEIK